MIMPMLSGKIFATNSVETFVWDVWIHSQIVCCKIEHLSNIDKMQSGQKICERVRWEKNAIVSANEAWRIVMIYGNVIIDKTPLLTCPHCVLLKHYFFLKKNRRYSLSSFRLSQCIMIHINSVRCVFVEVADNSTTHNTLLFLCSAEGISFT